MPVEMCTNNRIVGELLSVATQRDVVTGHQLPRLGSPYDTAPTEFSVEGRRPVRICCLICENLCTIPFIFRAMGGGSGWSRYFAQFLFKKIRIFAPSFAPYSLTV